MHVLTIFGVAGGAHRLWSHKSYKAKLPLRILLVLFFTAAGQASLVLNSIQIIAIMTLYGGLFTVKV